MSEVVKTKKCYECRKKTMTIEKKECFFCSGTGYDEALGEVCNMCDSENKLILISCSNEDCLLYHYD